MSATQEKKERPSIFHISDLLQNHNPLELNKSHCLKRIKRKTLDSNMRQYEVINLGLYGNTGKGGTVLQEGEIITICF
jgi:hypothetical protein